MKTIFLSIILSFSLFGGQLQAATQTKQKPQLMTLPLGEKIDLTVVDINTAQKIFSALSAQENIPFAFPERGCEARAHAMSLLLEKENIKTGKIFVTGLLKVATPNSPSGFVTWRYHVGLTLWVRHPLTHAVETYVIDPSLFNRPLKIHDWVALQMQNKNNRLDHLVQTPSYVYDLKFNESTSELSYNLADVDTMNERLSVYLEVQKERQNNK